MRFTTATCIAALMAAGAAQAGGIDRSGQSIDPLFKEGRYLEFSFGSVNPDVEGTQEVAVGPSPAGAESGDMLESFAQLGLAYKADINDRLSYAVIFDQPYGADVDYPDDTGFFGQNSEAELDADAITALVRYKFDGGFSVHGGISYQNISADAFIPFVTLPIGPTAGTPYTADGAADGGLGYVAGVAYERPEIALRVALTYRSEIDHSVTTTETSALAPFPVTAQTEFETPQSINLDFQTGIAPDTLLFGGVRWVDWNDFELAPPEFVAITSLAAPPDGVALLSYENDYISYNLGLGRRFNENWSGAVTIGYEPGDAEFLTNLGPTDGSISYGIGATYTTGPVEITGGVRYIDIQDAQTTLSTVDGTVATFDGSDAFAWGFSVGYTF